jgi:hypothetical protein
MEENLFFSSSRTSVQYKQKRIEDEKEFETEGSNRS